MIFQKYRVWTRYPPGGRRQGALGGVEDPVQLQEGFPQSKYPESEASLMASCRQGTRSLRGLWGDYRRGFIIGLWCPPRVGPGRCQTAVDIHVRWDSGVQRGSELGEDPGGIKGLQNRSCPARWAGI